MASYRKVLLLNLALVFFTSVLISAAAYNEGLSVSNKQLGRRRLLLEVEDEDDEVKPIKKNKTKLLKPAISSTNQTKLSKTTMNGATKNQTKLIKATSEFKKNKTKLIKPTSDSIKDGVPTIKSQLKKLNSTSKASNSNKASSLPAKMSPDQTKTSSAKNQTAKSLTAKQTKIQLEKKQDKEDQSSNQKPKSEKAQKKTKLPSWIDQDDDDDLVTGFRELPTKFQEALLPDLEKISKTSQVYLTRYNKEITKGVKPILGSKYASTMASVVSFAFVTIPLVLVSLVFNRIKAYFSLQKLLIFIQVYLSIYFSILCLSSIVTGLEPLKFFYATSQSAYVCLQVLQTLAYVFYLLLLLMYLVLVFSTETGLVTKLLGLAQTFVGFAVGLHYYVKVFHRVVLRQPPKTSWKIHATYAACFFVICLLTRGDGRKKAYLEEGGEEGKKN